MLIHSVNRFIWPLSYRVDAKLNPEKYQNKKKTFGIPTTTPPPSLNELSELKERMVDLVKNVEFRNFTNDFQRQLRLVTQRAQL